MSAEAQICIGTRTTTPDIPPTGKVCIWVRDSDGHLMQIDSSGTILDLTAMGASQLGGLSNVDINNPQTDEVLIYDGTNFVNTALPVSVIAQTVTSGNLLATHTSGDGTPVQILETVTTLSLTGDTLTFINEDNSNPTIDLSGYDQSTAVANNASQIGINTGDIITNASGITDNASDITDLETDLTTHENDTNNPHQVTITQAVAADAGTDITTAQLETLSDGSNANLLHNHSEIISADTLSVVTAANNAVSITVADEDSLTINSPDRHVILPFGNQQVKNMGDPTDPQDATTKIYVDNRTFLDAAESTTPLISQLANVYVPHQTHTSTVPETGNYLVEVTFIFSINTTTTNFISRLNINGTFSNELAIENKDSAGVGAVVAVSGGGNADTGTDQKIPGNVATIASLTAGANTIAFEFGGQALNQEATVYQSLIKVTRIP